MVNGTTNHKKNVMTNEELQPILNTVVVQRNRIEELEQQIELLRESQQRLVDKLLIQIDELSERVNDLLDPLERIQHGEESVQEASPNA
jgi:hypothetical protein